MKTLLYSALTTVIAIPFFVLTSLADPGDLFVQVELVGDEEEDLECSILKVDPDGDFSEFISNDQILAVTGQDGADCDDTGIACADNGDIYFSEDFPDSDGRILMATPDGELSLFVSNADLVAATGGGGDLDNGLVFGPDGNLYAGDDSSDSVLKITVPDGDVSIEITEEEIAQATGFGGADIEAGIAIDRDFNFYIVDATSDSVVTCRPGGDDCRVLTTDAQIQAVTGGNTDLDEGVVLGRFLYVVADICDCIIRIDTTTGSPELFITEDQIADLTGNPSDPDGGIALDQNARLYIGDDGASGGPNILRSNSSGRLLEIFVSDTQLENFYSSIAPGFEVRLEGSMCIEGVNLERVDVPTLSEWGMLAMAGVLGVIGLLFAMRRRAFSAK